METIGSVKIQHITEPEIKSNHKFKKQEVDKKIIDHASETKKEAMEVAKDFAKSSQKTLKIGVHEATGIFTVKVISKEDGKLIKQIPTKEMLDLATNIDRMTGILFKKDV